VSLPIPTVRRYLPTGKVRLVLLSFLVLFVELALIRWAGSNIVYLSFFANFVLLGSFLGIGVGFLRARSPINLFSYSPVALALLVGFALIFQVRIDRTGSDLIFFGDFTATGLPTWVTLPAIFVLVSGVMALLAEGLAREFVRYEPLEAYRLDIAGAILGILGFSALSFLGAPPLAWGVVAGICFLVLLPPSLRVLQVVAIFGLVFMLGRESFANGYSWSPYYRIGMVDRGSDVYDVEVNGIPHQTMRRVGELVEIDALYGTPYARAVGSPRDVLIIGAGTGNDVALALSQGAEHIDAVEIDPGLHDLGVRLHPDHPYQDSRVTAHITDGRAFLEQTDQSYDLILFALPDSLTLISGQSAVRLESYLFTIEAIESAREHLRPGGVFSMYNYYREDWLVDRLAGTLDLAFGHAPCVDVFPAVGKQVVLTTGVAATNAACESPWIRPADVVPPSTDDHPFLYLRESTVPSFYLLTMAIVLMASALMIRVVSGPLRQMRGYMDLFFMGVAFLLLETKSVVQFALLFGTTWFVNAIVFTGVLLSVYLAIEVARRFALPRPALLYGVLFASVLMALLIPVDRLLALPIALRFVSAVVLWFTPIFIANLVFAQRFRNVGESHVAFATNLLGAVVGGVLEYAALVTGYTFLAVFVALLYAAALVLGWRVMASRRMAAAAAPLVR
jgi:SAM-dependent methyltransferase